MHVVRQTIALSLTLLLFLAVPLSTTAIQSGEQHVSIYFIALGDDGQRGERVGCGDSLVPVEVVVDAEDSIEQRITASLSALFAIDDAEYQDTDLNNALHASDLAVESVTITGRSALVQLSGSLLTAGTCDVPRIEGQIEATITQFDEIDGAAILMDGDWLLPSARGAACFDETGHCVSDDFLNSWENNGAILVLGFPISDLMVEDGRIVQYFERQRLEYHPENEPPYTVLLGRLGFEAAEQRGLLNSDPFQPATEQTDRDDCMYFSVTGHNVCGEFLARWQLEGIDLERWAQVPNEELRYDSLHLFGYPLSEAFTDEESGLTVQYFERAVFEHHPNNDAPWNVLFQRLGVEAQSEPTP